MVRRHDDYWCQQHNPLLPERCDHHTCCFHTEPLVWNGEPLKPILEHHHGVNTDNRPENLQLLGPHGDSLHHATRGGANKGRTEKVLGGVAKVGQNGTRHDVRPAAPGRVVRSPDGKAAQPVIAADAKERRR
jgi:hypothetical protein